MAALLLCDSVPHWHISIIEGNFMLSENDNGNFGNACKYLAF